VIVVGIRCMKLIHWLIWYYATLFPTHLYYITRINTTGTYQDESQISEYLLDGRRRDKQREIVSQVGLSNKFKIDDAKSYQGQISGSQFTNAKSKGKEGDSNQETIGKI